MSWEDEVDAKTGGLLDQYTGPVVDAFFTDGQYGCQLEIQVKINNPEDHPNIPDGVVKNWFRCGPGWSAIKNGAEVTHETATKFNGNTEAGRLVAQMQAIDPSGATLSAGRTVEAKYWKALVAEWAPIQWTTRAFTAGDGTAVEAGTKAKVMPVKLLGQASTNGHAPADFDLAALGLSGDIINQLTEAARDAKGHSDFVPKAAAIQGVGAALQQIASAETGPRILKALQPF